MVQFSVAIKTNGDLHIFHYTKQAKFVNKLTAASWVSLASVPASAEKESLKLLNINVVGLDTHPLH